MDLLIRKFRRSKSSIELMDFSSDSEGNLIELMLSSNHKRFAHWLPGQFVYLNCPQIAAYEWHPFTISSMDNNTRQFTLHIKTGGDWTRKLRNKLALMLDTSGSSASEMISNEQDERPQSIHHSGHHYYPSIVPNFHSYDEKTGQIDVKCTKLANIVKNNHLFKADLGDTVIHLDDEVRYWKPENHNCCIRSNDHQSKSSSTLSLKSSISRQIKLDFFIDGPFHSPFERLMEQQVSLCIASGVGWTAFSSIFHSLTNRLTLGRLPNDWWTDWIHFSQFKRRESKIDIAASVVSYNTDEARPATELSNNYSKLHLLIIVTDLDELRPFYSLSVNYFEHMSQRYMIKPGDSLNPIKEITAFLTRGKYKCLWRCASLASISA